MTWCKNRFEPTPCCWESYSSDQCVGIVETRWGFDAFVVSNDGNSIGNATVELSGGSDFSTWARWAVDGCGRVYTTGKDVAKSHACDNGIESVSICAFLNAVEMDSEADGCNRTSASTCVFSAFACSATAAFKLEYFDSRNTSLSIVRYTVVNVCTQKRCNGWIRYGIFFSNQRHTNPTLNVSLPKKHEWVTDEIVRFIWK